MLHNEFLQQNENKNQASGKKIHQRVEQEIEFCHNPCYANSTSEFAVFNYARIPITKKKGWFESKIKFTIYSLQLPNVR